MTAVTSDANRFFQAFSWAASQEVDDLAPAGDLTLRYTDSRAPLASALSVRVLRAVACW